MYSILEKTVGTHSIYIKTLEEWSSAAPLKNYEEAYITWFETVFLELDADMTNREAAGDPEAQGWSKKSGDEIFYEVFYESWELEQSPTALEEYAQAREAERLAYAAYQEHIDSQESTQLHATILEEEAQRLSALGYNIAQTDDNMLYGYLSMDQILEFSIAPDAETLEISYVISFLPLGNADGE